MVSQCTEGEKKSSSTTCFSSCSVLLCLTSWLWICCLLPSLLDVPDSSVGKEAACNAGDLGSVPGLRRSPGEGKGYPLQYSGLENSMDWIVHGGRKSQTQLSLSLSLSAGYILLHLSARSASSPASHHPIKRRCYFLSGHLPSFFIMNASHLPY